MILAGVHYENLLEALTAIELPYVILGNTYIGQKDKLKKDALIYDDVGGAALHKPPDKSFRWQSQ